MPLKTHRRYWTLSTDGQRTPIEVLEVEDFPMNQPPQQVQYIQVPVSVDGSPQAIAPYSPPPPVMVRPQPRSPLPFIAGAVGLFLCFYSWNTAGSIDSLKQQNEYLTQQVASLQAQNQALKEMAAIVR